MDLNEINATQKAIVLDCLLNDGFITRNNCLAGYISRLGAIIHRLKKEGYNIVGSYIKTPAGIDYIYKLIY